jgi:cytolysin-activating lysine-acyltransferase
MPMRKSFLEVRAHPSELAKARVEALGFICQILAASSFHSRVPAIYLQAVVRPLLQHGQYKLFFDSRGDPVGFVLWALLAPTVEEQVMQAGVWDLHLSEWNEGDRIWIVDFAAPYGHFPSIAVDLFNTVFRGVEVLRYYRRRGGLMIFKEIDFTGIERLVARSLTRTKLG